MTPLEILAAGLDKLDAEALTHREPVIYVPKWVADQCDGPMPERSNGARVVIVGMGEWRHGPVDKPRIQRVKD